MRRAVEKSWRPSEIGLKENEWMRMENGAGRFLKAEGLADAFWKGRGTGRGMEQQKLAVGRGSKGEEA